MPSDVISTETNEVSGVEKSPSPPTFVFWGDRGRFSVSFSGLRRINVDEGS